MKYLQLLVIFLAFSGANVYAAPKMYAEVDAMRTEVEVKGVKFKPYQGKVKLGFYVQHKIGLEVHYVPGADEEESGTKMDIDHIYGAYLRLESNPHNRVRLYILAGYSETELSIDPDSPDFEDNKFDGFSWGIGLEDQMVRFRNTYFTLDYMEYYSHDDVDVTGISLGFRYLF